MSEASDHWLNALDSSVRLLHDLSQRMSALVSGPQNTTTSIQINQLQSQIASVKREAQSHRIKALRSIEPGDASSLTRAIGIPSAYPVFIELGIGSFASLLSCTRRQFEGIARNAKYGWGAINDHPPLIGHGVVDQIDIVLKSLNLNWRDPNDKNVKVRLPEPVLSKRFDRSFDPKTRFIPGVKPSPFHGYCHPRLVYGMSGQFDEIVVELARRGVYTWEDLTNRSASSLVNSGFPACQIPVVQREMHRRGLDLAKTVDPAQVTLDHIEVDKIKPHITVETVMGQEGHVEAKDKDGKVVGVMNEKDEYNDRLGFEGDVEHFSDGSVAGGVAEDFREISDEEDQEP